MNFVRFRDKLIEHFNEMNQLDSLFVVDLDKDKLYEHYLASYPAGTNPMYRKRTEHDCSCCRHFIKSIGNVVGIKDGNVISIWDFDCGDKTYQIVANSMSTFVKQHKIIDFYFSKENSVGVLENYEKKEGFNVKKWDHFYLRLPSKYVTQDVDSRKGGLRDIRNVFYRSLSEFSLESIDTVLELIAQNSLYRGNEWEANLKKLKAYKKTFDSLDEKGKEIFAWEKANEAGVSVGKIRNHSIGTLLIDINEGIDLDTAVTKYEKVVAPTNYKRPKAIFTQKMIEDAQKKIIELGYSDSLSRRFATLDDLTVNNILFSNRDVAKEKNLDVFGELKASAVSKPTKFNKVEEISAEKFVKDVLPTARELEVYFDGKNQKNLVSLIAPVNKGSKTMFKWNNGFSWAYKGNITDSIKQNVEKMGGNVTGDLRFSIQWNENGDNNNDFDAHCLVPGGSHIYYLDKYDFETKGQLDVDIRQPLIEIGNATAVENIFWQSRSTMKDGTYLFFVHNFSHRGGKSGFSAEIEFDGNIYHFDYPYELRQDERVKVAEVTLNDGQFTIKELLPASTSSKDIWGIKTNTFVPVSVVMYSPNYWDEQSGIGNKHYMFMLKGCVNDETPNGFFNEYLKPELETHKRVFEALGSKMKVTDSDNQLSGLGFSSTKRDEVVVKVIGSTERLLKIKF
jgi:hypothetical protein